MREYRAENKKLLQRIAELADTLDPNPQNKTHRKIGKGVLMHAASVLESLQPKGGVTESDVTPKKPAPNKRPVPRAPSAKKPLAKAPTNKKPDAGHPLNKKATLKNLVVFKK